MIPETDLTTLRTLCRLGDEYDIPPAVEEIYWRYKHTRDFSGAGPVHPDVLALLVFQVAPQGKPAPKPFSIATAPVEEGDTLIVQWRGKECFAEYRELTNRNSVKVVLEGDPGIHEVPVETVLGIAEKV